jgi:hypothetical protein
VTAGQTGTSGCTASYDSGTVVTLQATAAEGSSFGGWGADAAGCGTTPSCNVAMDAAHSVVAVFNSAAQAQITTSNWRPDPDFGTDGAVIWTVEVQNPTDQTLHQVRVDFSTRDQTGKILASDFTFLGPIPPGETRAAESFADYLGSEATADFQITDVEVGTGENPLAGVEITSSNWRADPDFGIDGAIIWTVEVLNTTDHSISGVRIDFSTFDGSGKILTADFTFVDSIPAGGTRTAQSFADYFGTEASVKFQVGDVGPPATMRARLRGRCCAPKPPGDRELLE